MAIARAPRTVLDCPDPRALAAFYASLLGWKVVSEGSNWADAVGDDGQRLEFQQVAGYQPPKWPGQDVPQQMHVDVTVDDLDAAETQVLELGAVKAEQQPGTRFRVFLDPAGHPFCLCLS
jgi:predicted enzyme related to lactoylglutathione lyase